MDDRRMPDAPRSEGERNKKTQSARARTSSAVRLLEQLIARDLASVEGLARALGISCRRLEEYRTGLSRMRLQSQRRLADLVLSQVPELAREARRLQLQCQAAAAFHAKETETHMIAPPRKFR